MAAALTATLSMNDHVLRIAGTPQADQIQIHNQGGYVSIQGINVTVTSTAGAYSTNQVAVSEIKSIEVSALAGDDLVQMNETLTGGSVAIPMIVRGGLGNDTIMTGSGNDIVYGGEVLDSTSPGHNAALLDSTWQFYKATSEFYNYLGKNEKWFLGEGGPWYYIQPNGEIYRSNPAGTSVGTYLATVSSTYHTKLALLLDAGSGPAAAQVDREQGLNFTGDYYLNWGGKNEKWVMSSTSGQWYFITPDGALYKQKTANTADGDWVAAFDHSYWQNPNKLTTASTVFGDRDVIHTLSGIDKVYAGADADLVYGGRHTDYLYGGIGGDQLYGQDGRDRIYGEAGKDTLGGGRHEDLIVGGAGGDTIHGDAHNDFIWGGSHKNAEDFGAIDMDHIYGDGGNDELHGGGGIFDWLYGGIGDDKLFGEGGRDFLYGGPDNDTLYGGAGKDALYGEEGRDGLFGGWGDGADTMSGGAGPDRFLQPEWERNLSAYNEDTVSDLAYEDAAVYFAQGTKSWTDAEVIQADKGLAFLHHKTNNTVMLKMPDGVTPITIRRYATVADGANGNNPRSEPVINISDNGVNAAKGLEDVIVHEIAHDWDQGLQMPFFAALSGWEIWNLTVNPTIKNGFQQAAQFGTLQSWTSGGETFCWIYRSDAQFSRADGYGRTDPFEDFATSLETYYALTKPGSGVNPASNWQGKWNFINNWLAGKTT